MHAFRNEPRLFSRMVAMHIGALSPFDIATNGISLGLKMLGG
jgi:hypothetical protein